MRYVIAILLLMALPVAAQEEGEGPEGWLPEGFTKDMRDKLEGLLGEVKPELEELIDRLGVIGEYEAPEILPNGDIIIRRKREIPSEIDPSEPIDI